MQVWSTSVINFPSSPTLSLVMIMWILTLMRNFIPPWLKILQITTFFLFWFYFNKESLYTLKTLNPSANEVPIYNRFLETDLYVMFLSEDYAIVRIVLCRNCSCFFFSKGSLSEDFLRCKFLNKIVYAVLYNICELTQKFQKTFLKYNLKFGP